MSAVIWEKDLFILVIGCGHSYAFRLWSHKIDNPAVFSECCFGVMVLSGFCPTESNLDGECLQLVS